MRYLRQITKRHTHPSVLQSTRKHLLFAYALLFAVHLAAAQIGFYVYQGISPAIVWVSAGVALAGLVLGGVRLWPSITAASIVNSVLLGQPILLLVAIAAGSTIQAIVATVLLERFHFVVLFNRLRDAVVFLVSCFAAAVIGPLIITVALLVQDTINATAFLDVFGRWWIAAALGFVVFSAVIVRWVAKPASYRSPLHWFEAALSFALACLVAFVLSWTPMNELFGISLVYILLAPFFWIAFRVGPRVMTTAIFAITLIFLFGVTFGWAESTAPLSDRIIAAELLSLVWAIIFFLLVAVAEERKEAIKETAGQMGQLESMVEKASMDAQIKTDFLAILAHELRNPLAPVLSSIELLKLKGHDEEERRRILHGMEERVHTMSRLLDDLLDISRITRKTFKLEREVIDARKVVESAVAMTEPLIQEVEHKLEVILPTEPVYVYADSVRLEQIIVNLLTNAAKYTPKHGRIDVALVVMDKTVEISVLDNGIGIPEEAMKYLFTPFLQIPKGDGRRSAGLGIGLSLTERLVKLHNGTIEVESEKGRGTEFTVRLPLPNNVQLPMPESKSGASQKKVGEVNGNIRPRIVVVDDNEAAARGLEELLTHKGYKTEIAFDGQQALKAVPQFKPHVVVLDIGLPDMSGYEVAERLRKSNPTVRLIAVTGYGQDTDKARAHRAGFNQHLTKPVGIAKLEEVLDGVDAST